MSIAPDVRKGSALADVDNGLRELLRSLLGQIVPDTALHEAMQIFAGELLGVSGGIRMWRTVLIALKGDGRYADLRRGGQLRFQLIQAWIALCQSKPPSIVMDHDIDVIRIIESCRATTQRRVVELPFR